MKNMFNVTTVLPHNLLQTNPCIHHNVSTQVSESARHNFTMWSLSCLFLMKNMFNVTTVLPHNLLWRPENVAQLRAHIMKLCRALSGDLCRNVMMNARVSLQEVVKQNGGHTEHVLH